MVISCIKVKVWNQTPGYTVELYSGVKDKYIVLCAYTRLSFTISHCHTHTHTDSSRLTGENIHCQCEKWSGTDGIRMIETTYNGSHNFPVSLSPSLVDRFLPLYLPAPAFSPSYTQAFSMASSLTALAKEAQAQWKPHGTTQSQPRGEREAGERERRRSVEGRRTQGSSCFISPPV